MFDAKTVLVTGGTGSFGKKFCETVLRRYKPKRLIVYSRDEHKQAEMMSDPRFQSNSMEFCLGDVRDFERLRSTMRGVDIVVHSAALKHVPTAEYNPQEYIKTNILGASNLVEAALINQVEKVIALSTDKAVNPMNLYGATKLCSDKILIAANASKDPTKFSLVRYGNVLGSRGSVIPKFLKDRKQGAIYITHPEMTRFYIKLEDCIEFVFSCLTKMRGGEIFIPKLPSCRLKDLANVIAPDAVHHVTQLRPGEKMHELLISEDEAHLTLEFEDSYVVQPALPFWSDFSENLQGVPCAPGFAYSSHNNVNLLNVDELMAYCEEFIPNSLTESLAC